MVVTFDVAFDRLIGHEGSFTDDVDDDGNWTGGRKGRGELRGTKYGISAASYPSLDIRNLSIEAAKEIYRRDFWLAIPGLSAAMRFQWFDACVNHGAGNATRMLQRAVGVAADGQWGPVSQTRLAGYDETDVLMLFLAARLQFMTDLKKFDHFGRGWSRRIAENLRLAAADT